MIIEVGAWAKNTTVMRTLLDTLKVIKQDNEGNWIPRSYIRVSGLQEGGWIWPDDTSPLDQDGNYTAMIPGVHINIWVYGRKAEALTKDANGDDIPQEEVIDGQLVKRKILERTRLLLDSVDGTVEAAGATGKLPRSIIFRNGNNAVVAALYDLTDCKQRRNEWQ